MKRLMLQCMSNQLYTHPVQACLRPRRTWKQLRDPVWYVRVVSALHSPDDALAPPPPDDTLAPPPPPDDALAPPPT
eukprot:CAMPEP_0202391894 /NCGR_PEP_ID=MMETSP1127-20130417/92079_1 /ASSEMBLY_ACC=CAM_ASM_000462 /TAXON_ID=3047 /ORGANISM="Dunaliella tertiolecta, Strain CCMP1320" /LENGTH=75 /DNA_ID=CAMNT_0048994355 /DNA_START=1094 /DNA_END=1321 /DNA_ORIENTATION=+